MRKYHTDGHVVDLDQPVNKYKVSVELTVIADSPDDAWELTKQFLDIATTEVTIENEDMDLQVSASDLIEDFDVLEAEPAELDW